MNLMRERAFTYAHHDCSLVEAICSAEKEQLKQKKMLESRRVVIDRSKAAILVLPLLPDDVCRG